MRRTLSLACMGLTTLACVKPRECTIYSTDVECHLVRSDAVCGTAAYQRAHDSALFERYRRAHLRAQSFYFETYPQDGEGRIHDAHPAMLRAELEQLHRALDELGQFDPAATIDPHAGGAELDFILEPAALRSALADKLLVLEVRRAPWRDPAYYLEDLRLEPYLAESSPLELRAAALVRMAEGAAAHLGHARINLEPTLDPSLIEAALVRLRAMLAAIEAEIPAAMVGLDEQRRVELELALTGLSVALREYEAFLAG